MGKDNSIYDRVRCWILRGKMNSEKSDEIFEKKDGTENLTEKVEGRR
jgi:hypothetical protein